jgi:cysteine desulfurase
VRFWKQQGAIDVVEVPVDTKGFVDVQAYVNLLKNGQSKVDLVSISHINNEVGTLQDIRKLCKIAHQYGAFFHTDATQSVGKVPINIRGWKLDSITWSSHKLYSVSGSGGLTLSKKLQPHVQQIMFGNDNEHKYRPGSTDLFSILCMAKAMTICNAEIKSNLKHLKSLTRYLLSLLVKNGILFRLNSGGVFSLNLSFKNSHLSSDELIQKLSQSRICVSKGSACKSRSTQESYVIDAMGLPEITPTLRIGIGKFNSKVDIDNFVAKLHTALG